MNLDNEFYLELRDQGTDVDRRGGEGREGKGWGLGQDESDAEREQNESGGAK